LVISGTYLEKNKKKRPSGCRILIVLPNAGLGLVDSDV